MPNLRKCGMMGKTIERIQVMSERVILFDLDGTLTDSGEGIIKSALFTLEKFGLPLPAWEEMRFVVGPPLHDSFLKLGVPAAQTDEAVRIYRTRYVPIGAYENHPYPGIEPLLARLSAMGYKLYVATSKPEAMSVKILEHFGLAKYFTLICGASYDQSRSTKADVIAHLLSQAGKSADILMVGDTAFDVIGAKAHGIPTIGVSWGYGDVAEMEDAGAKAIAHTMDELYTLLTT